MKYFNTIIKKNILNVLACLLAVVFLLPLAWMIIVSLKPDGVSAVEIKDWINFSDLTLDNYVKIITTSPILRWTYNSFVIGILTTVIELFVSSLAAYAFSKKVFKSKAFFYILILSGLLIPAEAIMIPLYDTVLHLKLIDNIWGIILPCLTNPLGILIIKQFMDGIPKDYMEAARLDGCKDLKLWLLICVPLTRSAMVSVGIYYFILSWNNFIWPYICITSQENMVLPTGLPTFLHNNILLVNTIMAASAIAAIPAMIIFVILQKQIIQGVVMSGIKA